MNRAKDLRLTKKKNKKQKQSQKQIKLKKKKLKNSLTKWIKHQRNKEHEE
jgi:hypothetical protein